MMLLSLLLLPFLAGLLSLISNSHQRFWPRLWGILGLLSSIVMLIVIGQHTNLSKTSPDFWALQWQTPWIPSLGISFHLGLDGLSFCLIALVLLVGLLAIILAKPKSLPGPFYAALLWAISATLGIFLSADIFLFLVFWELALLPIYFMLMVHSQEARSQALRFILFTQLSGLFLLIAIVSLAFTHYEHSAVLTFDYQQLIFGNFSATEQFYLLGLFLLAFLLKLPAFPVHSWLVGIFVHMPLPALLVGILVKTAVFGLLRFSWVLFPLGSLQWALPMMILGACGLIYGAILAFGQDDSKKVLAYGNLSHVGLLLIGVFCHNESSYFGVLLLLICQALSSGGLMILLDKLGDDAHGLWSSQTKLSAFLLVLVMASIGLPGFGNFVGEWLILSGSFAENSITSLLACSGIVLGALYSLKLFQKIAWPNKTKAPYLSCDLGAADLSTLSFIVVLLVTLGCYPNIIFKLANPQNFSSLKN